MEGCQLDYFSPQFDARLLLLQIRFSQFLMPCLHERNLLLNQRLALLALQMKMAIDQHSCDKHGHQSEKNDFAQAC